MNLGKAFKILREEKRLTRSQVASDIGLTKSALWKIEEGKTIPKQRTIEMFCYIYRVPVARLYCLAFDSYDFSLIE